jgi:aryl-alcohol dehydrogenase-like predicted oxidoreductase
MRQLAAEGLIRHIGVSNHSLAAWQRAEHALGSAVLCNQVRFSLTSREPEADLLPWAQREGRLVIAYSPLGQGLLSGRYQMAPPRNFRRMSRAFSAGARAALEPLIAALREIAQRHGATEAQIALAWLIRKPNVVAIPGASSVQQADENAAAADIELSDDDDAMLSEVAS